PVTDPLSLHDALPILAKHPLLLDLLRNRRVGRVPEARSLEIAPRHDSKPAVDTEVSETKIAPCHVGSPHAETRLVGFQGRLRRADRKSTRLNSSHDQI